MISAQLLFCCLPVFFRIIRYNNGDIRILVRTFLKSSNGICRNWEKITKLISIVVPVFNEEINIEQFTRRFARKWSAWSVSGLPTNEIFV